MYCTPEEVRAAVKDDFLSNIVGDRYLETEDERTAALGELIAAAIVDAGAEIDGYLGGRYPVPLDPAPKVIAKMCKDMAVYNLISRSGLDEQGQEKSFLTRYNSAIKFLTMVAEGRVSLGTGEAATVTAAPASYSIKADGRIFGRSRLEGM